MADFIGLFGDEFVEEQQSFIPADDDNVFDLSLDHHALSNDNIDCDDCLSNLQPGYLKPEPPRGHIEYKLKLISPSPSRLEHLTTQMKWRLREGRGQAIYELGVQDKGRMVGLSEEEASASLKTLYMMSEKIGASITILTERQISRDRKSFKILVRKEPEECMIDSCEELRVAVLGSTDVGKSTLLGVLTHGDLDNGLGSSRINLFRHSHEIRTGRTSSISREILGFNCNGDPLTYALYRTPEDICRIASKLITFIDLAGHHKYLRTTVFGLTGHLPHFALLVINSVTGLTGTSKEHLLLCDLLDLPVVIIVNKIDMVKSSKLEETIRQVENHLKTSTVNKHVPVHINSLDDLIHPSRSSSSTVCHQLVNDPSITPILKVSCVTGLGIDLLYKFLSLQSKACTDSINPKNGNEPHGSKFEQSQQSARCEFQVDETFNVSQVGCVVAGVTVVGSIAIGDTLDAGPFNDGSFKTVSVKSVHRNKVPCRVVRPGEFASLALSFDFGEKLRRGMLLLPHKSEEVENLHTCRYFQGRILLLASPVGENASKTRLCPGFQVTIYCCNLRQTATVIAIMGKKCLLPGQTGSVMFKFLNHPEFVRPGYRLLIRSGVWTAVGTVTQVFSLCKAL